MECLEAKQDDDDDDDEGQLKFYIINYNNYFHLLIVLSGHLIFYTYNFPNTKFLTLLFFRIGNFLLTPHFLYYFLIWKIFSDIKFLLRFFQLGTFSLSPNFKYSLGIASYKVISHEVDIWQQRCVRAAFINRTITSYKKKIRL